MDGLLIIFNKTLLEVLNIFELMWIPRTEWGKYWHFGSISIYIDIEISVKVYINIRALFILNLNTNINIPLESALDFLGCKKRKFGKWQQILRILKI